MTIGFIGFGEAATAIAAKASELVKTRGEFVLLLDVVERPFG